MNFVRAKGLIRLNLRVAAASRKILLESRCNARLSVIAARSLRSQEGFAPLPAVPKWQVDA